MHSPIRIAPAVDWSAIGVIPAASAVAAVVAANALLEVPAAQIQLLKFAMEGEIVASGAAHIDNIAPSLYGGLTLTVGIDNPRVKQIPVPPGLRCVLVHPHMYLGTREARAILNINISRSDYVWQSANLAGFISGCDSSFKSHFWLTEFFK